MKKLLLIFATLLLLAPKLEAANLTSKLNIDTVIVPSSTTVTVRYICSLIDTIGNHTDTLTFPKVMRHILVTYRDTATADTFKISYTMAGKTATFVDRLIKADVQPLSRDFDQAIVTRLILKATSNNRKIQITAW